MNVQVLVDNLDIMCPSSEVIIVAPDGSLLQIVDVENKGMDVVVLTDKI